MPAALPYVQVGNAKIAPFKYSGIYNQTSGTYTESGPFDGFVNTTKSGRYPLKQEVNIHGTKHDFKWASSEHAYHAQKLIHFKNKLSPNDPRQRVLTSALKEIEKTKTGTNEEYSPQEYAKLVSKLIKNDRNLSKDVDDTIRNTPALRRQLKDIQTTYKNNPKKMAVELEKLEKKAFDKLCDADYHSLHNAKGGLLNGEPYTQKFMKDVLKMKLDQNPELKQRAMECARQGIMPVEVSRYDDNWASGPNGEGKNMLGVAILELGNEYLKQAGGRPAIDNQGTLHLPWV